MSTPEPPPYPGDPQPESSGDLPSYGSVPPPPPDTPSGGDGGAAPPPPPPPPGPPTPPLVNESGFSAPEAIAWGWRKFTENVGPVLLGSLVMVLTVAVVKTLTSALAGGPPMGPGTMSLANNGPGDLVANLVQTTVGIALGGVAAKAALEVTEGQPYNFFAAFKKVDYVRLLLASLLVGVCVMVGFLFLIIPGLVLMFLTYLTTYSVVDDDKSPIEAFRHSIKLISANVGESLLLAILNVLVLIGGFFALCVGLLVAIPITVFATAYAYRAFNGQSVAS